MQQLESALGSPAGPMAALGPEALVVFLGSVCPGWGEKNFQVRGNGSRRKIPLQDPPKNHPENTEFCWVLTGGVGWVEGAPRPSRKREGWGRRCRCLQMLFPLPTARHTPSLVAVPLMPLPLSPRPWSLFL